MDRPLKEIVKDRMDKLGINILTLSRHTGIPSSRIYKWYPKNPDESKKANPKYPDIQILQEWMNKSDEEILRLEQVENGDSRESLGPSYREQLWLGKVLPNENYFPLIPYKARAGYSRNYENVDYVKENFDQFPAPPGIDTKGAEWSYFEVGGTSMLPTLTEGDVLFCNLLPHADWKETLQQRPGSEGFKVFVIVWNNEISVKRVVIDKGDLILISENEEEEKQRRIRFESVKAIWKVRRRITGNIPPSKRFKITV